MKITLAPVGSVGDIRPMIALGIKLRDRGDAITICGPPNFEKWICGHGFVFYPVGFDIQAKAQETAADCMGKPISGLKVIVKLLRELASTQYEGLFSAAKGSDLLLGAGLQFMGSTVAEALNIPYAHICHTPQLFESGFHPPVLMPLQNLPVFMNKISWFGYKLFIRRTLGKPINEIRKKAGLKEIENIISFGAKKVILAMDKEFAPMPGDVGMPYLQTGYWNLVEEGELGHELEEFIESGTPPVYIGFGSAADPSPEKTSGIIEQALDILNMRAVISRGWAGLGGDVKAGNILFTGPVSHGKLFPKMRAVIHHGGAGTSWSASRAGVPQVLVPHASDQFYWANRFFKLKLSPHPVSRTNLTGKKLASSINKAIMDGDIQKSCLEIQKKIMLRDGVKEAVEQLNSLCFSK